MWWILAFLALLVIMAVGTGIQDALRARSNSTDGVPRRFDFRNRAGRVNSWSTHVRSLRMSADDVERINATAERESWTTRPVKSPKPPR